MALYLLRIHLSCINYQLKVCLLASITPEQRRVPIWGYRSVHGRQQKVRPETTLERYVKVPGFTVLVKGFSEFSHFVPRFCYCLGEIFSLDSLCLPTTASTLLTQLNTMSTSFFNAIISTARNQEDDVPLKDPFAFPPASSGGSDWHFKAPSTIKQSMTLRTCGQDPRYAGASSRP